MKKRGIILVTFGKEYDRMGAACAAISRRNTDLPFYVLTNLLPSKRSPKWGGISNVTFQIFDWPMERNREAKLRMPLATPFEENLYLDCDSIIQRKGIEQVFDLLEDSDLVLNRYMLWNKGDKILDIYKRAVVRFKVELPLSVWNGAFICFKQNSRVKEFFALWYQMWEKFGKGREMPLLACAVNKGFVEVRYLPKGFFEAEHLDENVIVQHCTGQKFLKKFSLSSFTRWCPFDNDPKDFHWVEM